MNINGRSKVKKLQTRLTERFSDHVEFEQDVVVPQSDQLTYENHIVSFSHGIDNAEFDFTFVEGQTSGLGAFTQL
jgi:hypothetical protein